MPNKNDLYVDKPLGKHCGVGDMCVLLRDGVVHQVHRAWENDGLTECDVWIVWYPRPDLRPPLANCNQIPEPVAKLSNWRGAATCMLCIAALCEDV